MIFSMELSITYSIAFFIVVLFSACVLNLFEQHYVFQITGIAFLFMIAVVRITIIVGSDVEVSFSNIYSEILPALFSISACLISMSLGFWIFPYVRKKIKD